MIYGLAYRTIAIIVAAIALVVAAFSIPSCIQKRRSEAAQSRVDAGQAGAAHDSGKDAIGTVAAAGEREAASEDMTRANDRDIRAAEGAGDRVNPAVQSAGIKALCRRAAYQNDPRCKGVVR